VLNRSTKLAVGIITGAAILAFGGAAALRTGSGKPLDPAAAVPTDAGLQGDSTTTGEHAAPARLSRPDSVRALYVNAWAAGSRSRMADLVRIAETTEINALVIDIKESDSYLTHASTAIALAKEIGADQRPASKWLKELVDTLNAKRIYPIARIVVFKDRMLADTRSDLAIQDRNGGVWLDQKGKPWVNPYSRTIWDYNIAIAREALDMGFAEVQWDYVRYPDVTDARRATMVFPGADGKSREDNIRDFIAYSKQELASYGVPVTADVFGLVTHLEGDVQIGQNWEKVIASADAVLPMVYPSHYGPGLYGFQQPNAHPYEIVRLSLEDAVRRTQFLADSAGVRTGEVMPWLQAFSATWIDDISYGAEHLRAQVQATYDAGLKSWVLWNPGTKYQVFEDALRPEAGGLSPVEQRGWKAAAYTVPEERLSMVLKKRRAAAAARLAADSATPPPAVR
jgi:hypothetical protein